MKFSRIAVAFSCLLFLLVAESLKAQSAAGSGEVSAPAEPAAPMSAGAPATPPGSLGGIPSAPADLGAGAPAKPAAEPAAPIKLPEGYGGLGSVITPGEGRFAQPPFRFSISLSQGYDDNVLSTPDHPAEPAPVFTYSLKPETRFTGHYYVQPQGGNSLGNVAVPQYETVQVVVATPVKLPPPQQKVGSAVSRTSVSFQTQAATPRNVYTLDLGAGANEYWSRPGDTLDYNGNVGFLLFHKMTPRMNFTAAGSASTSSQPNYGNLYGPTQNTGQYLIANTKMDLSYRFSPRISTDLSYNLDSTLYFQKTSQTSDIYNNTAGAEFHYLVSPRASVVLNYRASSISYPQSSVSDSTENFVLVGADFDLSQRFHFTFRTGAQSKTYTNAQSTGLSSPYFESGLSYTYGRGSTLNWTTRYGFEETPSRISGQKTVSFRTGLSVNQVLTARIFANAGLNFNRLATSSTLGQNSSSTNQDQISLSLGLNYTFNPHLTLYLNYSFNEMMTTPSSSDYTRNQTFLGANYTF